MIATLSDLSDGIVVEVLVGDHECKVNGLKVDRLALLTFCTCVAAAARKPGDEPELFLLGETEVQTRFASGIVVTSDRSHGSCMGMIEFLLEKAEEGKL